MNINDPFKDDPYIFEPVQYGDEKMTRRATKIVTISLIVALVFIAVSLTLIHIL